ncbi:hypothetical protein L1887_11768 [Cichorium endivia]|nr:hypothetical protein L1887_11768 [Cichorium endivia]
MENYSLLIPLLLLLSREGLSEFREKWTTNRHQQNLSKWISMFISPSGEHVAIAVGNEITILQRDDNYQEPCGIFTYSYPITYTFGAWSEDHGVLGVFDSTDTLYFIRANGEEITRITKQHLKVPLPIISFVIHDDKNVKKSCLCTFSILASDGSVHDIEISQDPSASISTTSSSHVDSLLQKNSLKIFLVVGTYSISLWQWCRQSGLQQVSSSEFEGLYTKTKGYTDQMSSPKVVFSPQGEFIATVDWWLLYQCRRCIHGVRRSRREQGDQRRWMGTKGEIDGVKSERRRRDGWERIDGVKLERRRRDGWE